MAVQTIIDLGIGTKKCATPQCPNDAQWISIPEGNQLGSKAPYRCGACCETIWQETINYIERHKPNLTQYFR